MEINLSNQEIINLLIVGKMKVEVPRGQNYRIFTAQFRNLVNDRIRHLDLEYLTLEKISETQFYIRAKLKKELNKEELNKELNNTKKRTEVRKQYYSERKALSKKEEELKKEILYNILKLYN